MNNDPPLAYYIMIGLLETATVVHPDWIFSWGCSSEEGLIENFKRIAATDNDVLLSGLQDFYEFTRVDHLIEILGE